MPVLKMMRMAYFEFQASLDYLMCSKPGKVSKWKYKFNKTLNVKQTFKVFQYRTQDVGVVRVMTYMPYTGSIKAL